MSCSWRGLGTCAGSGDPHSGEAEHGVCGGGQGMGPKALPKGLAKMPQEARGEGLSTLPAGPAFCWKQDVLPQARGPFGGVPEAAPALQDVARSP